MLWFLAHMDGLRSEMLETRQETAWGNVFFLHTELGKEEKARKMKVRNRCVEALKRHRIIRRKGALKKKKKKAQ